MVLDAINSCCFTVYFCRVVAHSASHEKHRGSHVTRDTSQRKCKLNHVQQLLKEAFEQRDSIHARSVQTIAPTNRAFRFVFVLRSASPSLEPAASVLQQSFEYFLRQG